MQTALNRTDSGLLVKHLLQGIIKDGQCPFGVGTRGELNRFTFIGEQSQGLCMDIGKSRLNLLVGFGPYLKAETGIRAGEFSPIHRQAFNCRFLTAGIVPEIRGFTFEYYIFRIFFITIPGLRAPYRAGITRIIQIHIAIFLEEIVIAATTIGYHAVIISQKGSLGRLH
jgi:hypothetical protein